MRQLLCLLMLVALPSIPAGAQEADGRLSVECRGQPISSITVYTRPPFTPSTSTFVTRTAQVARRLHATSKPSLIRRYLVLAVGYPCTEIRRAESERILRAQPFIADAAIAVYADGADSVAVEVTTVDEFSLIVGGAVTGKSPHVRAVRLGSQNLMGNGIYAAAQWRDGRGFRDEYGVRVVHYQLFGRPYQLDASVVRRNVGHDAYLEVSQPYLTDLQRMAWRTHYGLSDTYVHFLRGTDTAAWLGMRRTFGDAGGVIRIGGPGLLLLAGGSLSQERDRPEAFPVVLDAGTITADTSSELIRRYPMRRQTRLNMLFGLRDLRFMRVTGFESLDGVQDVPRGFQLSGLFGRGMTFLDEASDRGVFASTWLYGGIGSPKTFAAADIGFEARRETSSRQWVGVVSSARGGVYSKPSPRHTFVTSLEWSAGWRSRVPFQLSFADPEGGLRGFSDSRIGGGQRLVLRLEDRYHWGRVRRYGSLGVAAFTDVGKLWAGDAPFGMDSRLSASLGVSLLASIPTGSQRLIRLDLAYPLNSDGRRSLEARMSTRVASRLVWREPRDVRHAREQSVPSNVFNWP